MWELCTHNYHYYSSDLVFLSLQNSPYDFHIMVLFSLKTPDQVDQVAINGRSFAFPKQEQVALVDVSMGPILLCLSQAGAVHWQLGLAVLYGSFV